MQKSQPEFRGALMDFIRYILADDKYAEKLLEGFETHRDKIIHEEKPGWHKRYVSMLSWYLAIPDIFINFYISVDNL